ncbi:MAG: hypothetical protein AABW80_00775 [Nanoarchaeota archaeon]
MEKLAKKRKIKPGMIIGMYYPRSKYNEKARANLGNGGYTHVVVYLGCDENGNPCLHTNLEQTSSQRD